MSAGPDEREALLRHLLGHTRKLRYVAGFLLVANLSAAAMWLMRWALPPSF